MAFVSPDDSLDAMSDSNDTAQGFLSHSNQKGQHSDSDEARWSAEAAQAWYASKPWLLGANFLPSTAINQLDMFQIDTFDPTTIRRELGWAVELGMNSMRVYLHDLLWLQDPGGFKQRLNEYLDIASDHGLSSLLVLFDDCHRPDPQLGPQPEAAPGCHNPGWVKSPGPTAMQDQSQRPRLEAYVKDILSAFGSDPRILMWDLYNEPGGIREKELLSLALLQDVFQWARAVAPSQPLTAAVWKGPIPTSAPSSSENDETATAETNAIQAKINRFMLENSDVITFHDYSPPKVLATTIQSLKQRGRPVICTEYLARTRGSLFQTSIPIFLNEKVGAYNWGLVWGKSGTVFPWGSPKGAPEPDVWFCDILRGDGTPFDATEVALLKQARQRAQTVSSRRE